MSKLVIFESPDALGKSCQVKRLSKYLDAKIIVQPSENNVVGFLRNEVKNNPDYNAFERQMLHTISHIVDLTEFDGKQDIIMDRSFISTYVYGKVTGMNERQNDLLLKIHQNTYKAIANNYDIYIIFLDRDHRYDPNTTDVFEKTFDWHKLRKEYLKFYANYKMKGFYIIHPNESLFRIDLGKLNEEQVNQKVISIIEEKIDDYKRDNQRINFKVLPKHFKLWRDNRK